MGERTITEKTSYGEVSYDVVDCDSCGNEIVKEQAKRFAISDPDGSNHTNGWVCPYCADNPVAYPDQDKGPSDRAIRLMALWVSSTLTAAIALYLGFAGGVVGMLAGIALMSGCLLIVMAITD